MLVAAGLGDGPRWPKLPGPVQESDYAEKLIERLGWALTEVGSAGGEPQSGA